MGLDNGITVKHLPKELYPLFNLDKSVIDEKKDTVEVCYWRKCWGIREAILKVLNPKGVLKESYSYNIDREDIPAIIRALKSFLKESYWEENADSIFEFDEFFTYNLEYIVRLQLLYHFMADYPNIEISFYDSY